MKRLNNKKTDTLDKIHSLASLLYEGTDLVPDTLSHKHSFKEYVDRVYDQKYGDIYFKKFEVEKDMYELRRTMKRKTSIIARKKSIIDEIMKLPEEMKGLKDDPGK